MIIKIRAVASALPSATYDSATVAGWCGSDEDFLRDKVGIISRSFLGEDEDELSLSTLACNRLFTSASELKPEMVGLCIYVGQAKKQIIPHTSAILQHRLGIPSSCVSFDIGLACSGYTYALAIAKSFMSSHNIKNALIVTCDPYSLIMGRTNRETVPLFGDAASATWLSQSGTGLEIGEVDLGTDGSKSSFLECNISDELKMNGHGIFNFVMECVPSSIQRCLTLNQKKQEEIDYFFFHQANKFILTLLCQKMGIPSVRCPLFVENVANTVSSSIPLLLENYFPTLRPGANIVMSGFGGGLSWGTVYGVFKE